MYGNPWGVPVLLAVLAPMALLGACAVRRAPAPDHYTLVAADRSDLLLPPGLRVEEAPGRRIVRLPEFRPPAGSPAPCRQEAGPVRWIGTKKGIELHIDDAGVDTLLASGHMLAAFDELRGRVLAAPGSGCLAGGAAGAFVERIGAEFRLPTSALSNLRYGNYAGAGYLEILPGFRLTTVAPLTVTSPGDAKPARALVAAGTNQSVVEVDAGVLHGYETAHYDVRSESGSGWLGLEQRSVVANIAGVEEARAAPVGWPLEIPPGTVAARVFPLTRVSAADHDAVLVAFTGQARLDEVTRAMLADPDSVCTASESRSPGVTCLWVPPRAALSVELPVTVNGRNYYLPAGSAVQDALRTAEVRGEPAALLERLRIERPYGRGWKPVVFDPGEGVALRMRLAGGERLTVVP